MRPNSLTRLRLPLAIGIASLTWGLLAGDAGSTPRELLVATFHPSAVKGQTIELEILAPPAMTEMAFKMQGKKQMADTDPPFRFSIPTSDLRPAHYKWHSYASAATCCEASSAGGAIQIYPLPRVRAPKVSALVVAGTAHLVGLVVSRVAQDRVVRAWSFPRFSAEGEVLSLPLQLRYRHRAKRVYRFARGIAVDVGKRTEIDVEVAPTKRTVHHGVEVRGRLARIWLTRNRRNGKTRAHRSGVSACTTVKIRKETLPGRQSCTTASPKPAVSIVCGESVPCMQGVAEQTSARQD
jgi:hypothetical protein